MKIGVISDTHITDLGAGLDFFERLGKGPFAEVDVILHAGDIVHPDLLYCFDTKPLVAVRGNCDETSANLPERRIEEFRGVRIGMVHGWGGPEEVMANVLSSFENEQLDVLVFGHSHYPFNRQNGDLLLFNPGSATDRRQAPYHSVGLLKVNGSTVTGSIINIDRLLFSYEKFNGGSA